MFLALRCLVVLALVAPQACKSVKTPAAGEAGLASAPGAPLASVEPGARDERGQPLPSSTQAYETALPTGRYKFNAGYRVGGNDLSLYASVLPFKRYQQDTKLLEDNVLPTSGCQPEEVIALLEYTSEADTLSYKDLNPALRAAASQPPNPDAIPFNLELAARVTASAINCVDPARRAQVVRGAKLDAATLALYQPNGYVVEHAFTSATMSDSVLPDFVGNVEFHILDAHGADLSTLSRSRDEEGEMLIQASTIFKVLSVAPQGPRTVVVMRQLP